MTALFISLALTATLPQGTWMGTSTMDAIDGSNSVTQPVSYQFSGDVVTVMVYNGNGEVYDTYTWKSTLDAQGRMTIIPNGVGKVLGDGYCRDGGCFFNMTLDPVGSEKIIFSFTKTSDGKGAVVLGHTEVNGDIRYTFYETLTKQ